MRYALAGWICMTWAAAAARAEDRFAAYNANPTLVAPTGPRTPAEQQKMFKLPPGFEIQLIASEPAIHKPMNIAFDAQGRLYLTSSLEYPYPAKPPAKPRDALLILEDIGADGKAKKITTFADGLNIPIGVQPTYDGVLCHSIPSIYRFRDTTGAGKADQRSVAYSKFGFQDTHGMASNFHWWIDGWIYACHGFANTSEVKGSDGQSVRFQSGNTYRIRPDGSHIEQFTHGQVNPFGLCFDPLGNVYSSDCHTKPAYLLLRGAWYPSFGTVHDGLGMGPELVTHLHGSTGIAGIQYYAADHFPPEYHGTLFIGNPVTGRINRDSLEQHGSSYRGIEKPDFVSCDDPWFRPVHLQIGPDGALYVADFYNKIIGHYEVPLDHPQRDRERGRLWRIVYRGTKEAPAKPLAPIPDLTRLDAKGLCAMLGDVNLTNRVQAVHQLVHRIGAAGLADVRAAAADPTCAPRRAHALWTLERLGSLDDVTIGRLANDEDRLVRVHVVKLLAERPNWGKAGSSFSALAVSKLSDPDPFVRRAAADALGRHPDLFHVGPLLSLWTSTPADDALMIHTARMALRDNLAAQSDLVKTAEMFPLQLRPNFDDVCMGIRDAKAADLLVRDLEEGRADRHRLGEFVHHAARYGSPDAMARLTSISRVLRLADVGTQKTVVAAVNQGCQERGQALPAEFADWASSLARMLLAGDEGQAREGIDFVRDLRIPGSSDSLTALAGAQSRHPGLRPAAITALQTVEPARNLSFLVGLLANLNETVGIRKHTAETLGMIHDPASLAELTRQLPIASDSLANSVARGLSRSDAGSEALLDAVEKGKANPRLLRDAVVAHELRFRTVQDKDARLEKLLKDLPNEDERLSRLVSERLDGFRKARTDVAAGGKIFEKTCAKCHQINGQGAKIGPQLDGVGQRGPERVLEDVLKPNQNVDQAFRVTAVSMTDGRLISGLVLREEGAVLVMADAEGKEIRLPKADIEAKRVANLSPMPADVATQLPEGDLYNLIAFLVSQRAPQPPQTAQNR